MCIPLFPEKWKHNVYRCIYISCVIRLSHIFCINKCYVKERWQYLAIIKTEYSLCIIIKMKLPFGLRDITYFLSFSPSPEKNMMGVGDNGNTTRVNVFLSK